MSPMNRYVAGFAVALGLACVLGAALRHSRPAGTSNPSGQTTARSSVKSVEGTAKARLVESYGKLPLIFEANQGQTNEEVKFLTRAPGYMLLLTRNEAVLSLGGRKSEA